MGPPPPCLPGLRIARVASLVLLAGTVLVTARRGAAAVAEGAPNRRSDTVQLQRREAVGHSRPRALAVDVRGDLLYAALSTSDRLAIIDLAGRGARRLGELPICRFPGALAPLPGGGVVVVCRFDPALRVVTRVVVAGASQPRFRVRVVDAGPEHGHQGLAVSPDGRFAYVTSPALGGVKVVSLDGAGGPPRFTATGLSPRTVRLVTPTAGASSRNGDGGGGGRGGGGGGEGGGRAADAQGDPRMLLLVSNFIGHTVTVHEVRRDGGLSLALQTIATHAPVLDLAIVPPNGGDGTAPAGARAGGGGGARGVDSLPLPAGALLLATYEDRPLSRERLSVEGLDSVLLVLPPATSPSGAIPPFLDPGPGKRQTINLSERAHDPLVALEAVAVDPPTGNLAVTGAGTDNLLVFRRGAFGVLGARAAAVGAHPVAVAFLPDGRVATADRLGDTLSFVSTEAPQARDLSGTARGIAPTVTVGHPGRSTLVDRGELLFYSRALVPHNVADGPLSLYTCAACHADGQIDGRLHPSKRNKFFSMTKTCRGLAGTEPFLSLGTPDTFAAFADNIVATHAQGALEDPHTYDQYPVRLPVRVGAGAAVRSVTLSPAQVRAALAAYLAAIPGEPSPYVQPGRRQFTESERRGLATFTQQCTGCHQLVRSTRDTTTIPRHQVEARLLAGEVALTNPRRYDVGTPVIGDGGNNPPSLRNTWAAAPYFTDGSARTLEEVLRRTNPDAPKIHAAGNAALPPALPAAQREDLLAFLRAL